MTIEMIVGVVLCIAGYAFAMLGLVAYIDEDDDVVLFASVGVFAFAGGAMILLGGSEDANSK